MVSRYVILHSLRGEETSVPISKNEELTTVIVYKDLYYSYYKVTVREEVIELHYSRTDPPYKLG